MAAGGLRGGGEAAPCEGGSAPGGPAAAPGRPEAPTGVVRHQRGSHGCPPGSCSCPPATGRGGVWLVPCLRAALALPSGAGDDPPSQNAWGRRSLVLKVAEQRNCVRLSS